MSVPDETLIAGSTAALIRGMAAQHHVSYLVSESDRLANQITRPSGDVVELDEIEQLLIALQRAGHISRDQLVQLQARYLRETQT